MSPDAKQSEPVARGWHLVLLGLGSAVAWAPASVAQALHPPASAGGTLAIKLCFLAVWVGPQLLYGKRELHTTAARFLGLSIPREKRPYPLAIAAALGFLAATTLLDRALGNGAGSWTPPRASDIALTLALAWAEEVPLRGFLLLQAARTTKLWKANLLVSLLFAAVHVPVFLARGLRLEILPISLALFLLSLVLGWVTRLTNSVWLATLLHAANNLLAST